MQRCSQSVVVEWLLIHSSTLSQPGLLPGPGQLRWAPCQRPSTISLLPAKRLSPCPDTWGDGPWATTPSGCRADWGVRSKSWLESNCPTACDAAPSTEQFFTRPDVLNISFFSFPFSDRGTSKLDQKTRNQQRQRAARPGGAMGTCYWNSTAGRGRTCGWRLTSGTLSASSCWKSGATAWLTDPRASATVPATERWAATASCR